MHLLLLSESNPARNRGIPGIFTPNAHAVTNKCSPIFMAALTIVRTGHPVLLLMFRSSLFFFRHLIFEVAWPIVAKLCHMFDGDPDL